MECVVDLMFCLDKEGDLFIMGFNANTLGYEGFVVSAHRNRLRSDMDRAVSTEADKGPSDVRSAVPYAVGSAAMYRPMWAVDVAHAGQEGLVVGHDPDVQLPGAVSPDFVDQLLKIDPELLEKLKASIDPTGSRQAA